MLVRRFSKSQVYVVVPVESTSSACCCRCRRWYFELSFSQSCSQVSDRTKRKSAGKAGIWTAFAVPQRNMFGVAQPFSHWNYARLVLTTDSPAQQVVGVEHTISQPKKWQTGTKIEVKSLRTGEYFKLWGQ